MDIKGSWTGALVFGHEYGRDAGKELYFEIELNQDNNLFTGMAKDTGGFGASPDPAHIKGNIDGPNMKFQKYYESFHTVDQNGNKIVDKSKEGPKIEYAGVYNESTKEFTGNWYIPMQVNEGGVIKTIHVGGTWKMNKKG